MHVGIKPMCIFLLSETKVQLINVNSEIKNI